jgi:phosphomannomutase
MSCKRWPATEADLADRFAGPLRFGTAGLRGPLRAGPNGMNLAVVRGAAKGLIDWLAARDAQGPLVVGFDARHGSRRFAEETARVATGAGREALLLPEPLPTPILAHLVRAAGAAAGVMVTASHNPPQDNGYKVYLADGAQLVPPADAEIEAAIRAAGPLSTVPLGDGPTRVLDASAVKSYVDGAVRVVDPDGYRDLVVAYTPLHGVGRAVFTTTLTEAGFTAPIVVPEQADPDPAFPTVTFPNPEEPGAMDLVLAAARAAQADLAIANDPDADRCAVAIPAGDGGWRMLRGDEVGALLADHLMRRGVRGRYATTIVSSTLLSKLCAARGLPYGETLTGFKWIVRAGDDLVYGYEEALGYCVAPTHVRDKDGITAALLVCELAAGLKAEFRTLGDRLDEIAVEYGVHATDQLSVRVDDLSEIDAAMATIRRRPPESLLDEPVTTVDDLAPEADVLTLKAESARVVVRPSGTEPKLKAYLEVVEPVFGDDVAGARERAAAALVALRTETAAALGLP